MPQIPDGELSIVEASSFRDYLFLRSLRNQVRNLMTNNTEPIGYLTQLRFYIAIKYRLRGWQSVRIFIARHGTQRVGYLLIRETDDGAVLTEAVGRYYRRLGVGKKLIEFAQHRYPNLAAEIRDENASSIALHESMGFRLESRGDGILRYRFRR
jgi:ribosomal protein S18 acetylase RimI-like enzyme